MSWGPNRAALLSPTRSSQPAVFPAGILHPGKEWQVCAGPAGTTCGSLYHWPCRKKVSGPRRSLYPWDPSHLGSVLLCPLQHNANPHLHHAAEASSPCHEIFMPTSKRGPAQHICVPLCRQTICAAECGHGVCWEVQPDPDS